MDQQERNQMSDVRGEKIANEGMKVRTTLSQEKLQRHLSFVRNELAEDYPLSLKRALSERAISLNRKKLTQILKEDEQSEEAR
ncbi:hypothetical protein JOC95_002779 [Bacillus tianshenii]|uniref:Uncharacterized protein n=1 Tax=Sutcliffiella tianshenii TaxID=1463404 RepID=A0ABS2P1U5_9BACI|nr:hypothetical protein [Bacillus tianshenii]MBM7620924.1 hypothetical protein [Bacillus tianshenii]